MLAMTDTVAHFKMLAKQYCQLIESAESATTHELLGRLHGLLPALIAAAQTLPETEPASEDLVPSISHEDWAGRFSAVNAALGEQGHYWTTGDANGLDEPQVLMLPLADDLADIWRDIKSVLLHLESGGASDDAVWQWRFDFTTHWGSHACEALRAVHQLTL